MSICGAVRTFSSGRCNARQNLSEDVWKSPGICISNGPAGSGTVRVSRNLPVGKRARLNTRTAQKGFMDSPFPSSRSIPKLIAAVLACNAFGSLGALVTVTGPGSWYAALEKPFFTPPGWVFAPVWITLFTLMGIALFLIWESGTGRREVRVALAIFCIQFVFNVLWSFLFFGLRSPFLGLADITLLWVLIAATIAAFYRVRKSAAWLLIPYICWVTIAMGLNFGVYILNP